jgi:hypothetical protein
LCCYSIHYNYWLFNQPVFSPYGILYSAGVYAAVRVTACYHRLIYYDRSNGDLDVDSFIPCGGAVSAVMSYLIIILIYVYCSVSDHGGKYQKAISSANAICKYVTGFSFMVFLRRYLALSFGVKIIKEFSFHTDTVNSPLWVS